MSAYVWEDTQAHSSSADGLDQGDLPVSHPGRFNTLEYLRQPLKIVGFKNPSTGMVSREKR
jgi:hypothetical protein